MSEILDVSSKVIFDTAVRREEWHTYDPYTSTRYENSDEIRIPIHHQDICTTPHDSYIVIEGRFTKPDGATLVATDVVNVITNGFAFLFDEIRYELSGIEIDKVKNAGITTLMKGYISIKSNEVSKYETAGWNNAKLVHTTGDFIASIPLKLLLGFAEDFNRIILNAKQELILVRFRTDKNVYINATEFKINLFKVQWRIKHIYPSDEEKLNLLNIINNGKVLQIPFRNWDLYEYPVLPIASKQIWAIKSSSHLETPRYVVLGFQSDIKNNTNSDSSKFNHCKLTNVKVFLNSQCFPYENLNLNFDKNQYSVLYEMYTQFQNAYYKEQSNPLLSWKQFKDKCLIVIDCSKQSEQLKSGPVDIRLEFEAAENFPNQTTAYCLILHDRIVEYTPLTGIVNIL